ncbi:MAG: hypothetical protein PUC09_03275 [Methanobrevibacter wolinii]|nr:hypothetical protein [Methanobrevibacter wolinii]
MVMEDISLVGNVREDEIVFSDFIIKIDFGDKKFTDDFGFWESCSQPNRRSRLFDKKGNLIEEVIDDNPYQFDVPYDVFSENPDIIY